MLSWVVVLAVVAFLASVAFKMIPHYLDYMSMDKIIKSAETDKSTEIKSVGDFYSHVEKGMQVNGIRDLNSHDILTVELANDQFKVHLKYEKREPIIQNLDLVARFDKEYRLRP